jgi:peptidoglycan/xylan/chitin deacetylase (PgdA/CDA1 family)
MKKILALILGASVLLSACEGTAVAAPVSTATETSTPSRSTPPGLPPTETATVTPTSTITPTFTASPIPTPTWVHLGPDWIQVPIILYHRIDISPINSQYYVPPKKFEEEIKLLHDWEYTTITTEMLIKAITAGNDLPPRPIIITFDDGHLDNYTSAFPIMKKYGFTGVLYIVGNYMSTDGYMDADQIKEMAAAGWEIGSHSMNHRDLTLLDDPERERYEIVESKEKLEAELGVPVKTFAYPFGISNEGVIDYVHFAGYIAGMSLGFTYDQGLSNLYTLQRRDIQGGYDVKKFAAFLPWAGNPIYLPTDTPTPTPTPTRTKIPTYTQYPTSTSPATATP